MKKYLLVFCFCSLAFLGLNYLVFLDHSSGSIPLIQSHTDAPLVLDEIPLYSTQKPDYIHPFRQLEFCYQNITLSGCEVIEQSIGPFSMELKTIKGDPYEYWNGYEKDGFMRPLNDFSYANVFFFLLQYLLGISGLVSLFLAFHKISD